MQRKLVAIACAALLASAPACARAADFPPFQVSQLGDLEKSCHELSLEVSAMEDLIAQATQAQDASQITSTGVTVAKTVGSYLVGTLAGGLGVLAAGYIVSEATDDRFENAAAVQDLAAQRRSFMAGIYNARGCKGPLEKLADIEPAAGDDGETAVEPTLRKPRYND